MWLNELRASLKGNHKGLMWLNEPLFVAFGWFPEERETTSWIVYGFLSNSYSLPIAPARRENKNQQKNNSLRFNLKSPGRSCNSAIGTQVLPRGLELPCQSGAGYPGIPFFSQHALGTSKKAAGWEGVSPYNPPPPTPPPWFWADQLGLH